MTGLAGQMTGPAGAHSRACPQLLVGPFHENGSVWLIVAFSRSEDETEIHAGERAGNTSREGKILASIEGRKPVAESHPRRQIPKRHRGRRNAGSPRRLIDLVTQKIARHRIS